MTKEELGKEAQRSFDELDDWCVGDDWSIEESYKNGYSNGAEPREKRIAELEAQIEKMKCLLKEIYSEFGFSELVKIRNNLPIEIQETIKEIKEK